MSLPKLRAAQGLLTRLAQANVCCPHHAPATDGPLDLRKTLASCADAGHAEYAFESIGSTLRFGPGVTAEIAYDVLNLKAKRPLILTDKNVAGTRAFT